MSVRRLLLIDSDEVFYNNLYQLLSPYGFEIYRVPESPTALNQIDEIAPELIFIAVEEPQKIGYSLCNKARNSLRNPLRWYLPPRPFHLRVFSATASSKSMPTSTSTSAR